MPPETLTLHLQGDVPLGLFAQTMERFAHLVSALSHEVSQQTEIIWTVADLAAGSATITIAGASPTMDAIVRVSRAYAIVGESLATSQPIPYSPNVVRAAYDLTNVISDTITALRFGSDETGALVTASEGGSERIERLGGYGSVEGRIETLMNRQGLSFTLYDSTYDRPVRCEAREDQREQVRAGWNHHVAVHGWIQREADTGRPTAIRPVTAIEIIETPAPGAFRRARGVVPFRMGRPPVEETIRKLRDA